MTTREEMCKRLEKERAARKPSPCAFCGEPTTLGPTFWPGRGPNWLPVCERDHEESQGVK